MPDDLTCTGCGEYAGIPIADRIEELEAERDHWRDVAGREGVCMTCRGPEGAPETYGCTDCLNTGYCGEHHNIVANLEAKLEKAEEALKAAAEQHRVIAGMDMMGASATAYNAARFAEATLAELKGQTNARCNDV